MDKIDDMIAGVLDFVEKAMSGIQKKICKALAMFNKIADTVLKAINTFKDLKKVADGISSIFSVDFTSLNFSSILDIISAIIGFIAGFITCGRKSRKPRAKGWLPLLGTTECTDIGEALAGPGGGNYADCGSSDFGGSTGGNIFDSYFQEMNPFLQQTQMFLNGARDIDDATPGKEKRVRSGPGGVTSFEDKRGNKHTNVPNNETAIYGRDLVQNVKNNLVHTVEGDYYLKVMGDFHLEVSGSMNEHTSNGPGAKAKSNSDSSFFKGGDKWLDQASDTLNNLMTAKSGGSHFDVDHGEKEAKSVQTKAGDHDISYQGDITIQGARVNIKGINAVTLDAPEINNQANVITNKASGEIINEANWITSFLACGRFDVIAVFSAMPSVVTGQYSLVKGAIVDVTMDAPFPGVTPPAQIRMGVGNSKPAAMADLITGGSPGAHVTLLATPKGGIAEVVTGGTGAIINQCTTGLVSYGVGTGLAALGSGLGPTQIYGLPVMLN